jgi:hypothetical protein
MLGFARHNLLINPAPHAFPSNTLVLLVASIVVAVVSYWVVEYPVMQLRHLFTEQGRFVERFPHQGTEETEALGVLVDDRQGQIPELTQDRDVARQVERGEDQDEEAEHARAQAERDPGISQEPGPQAEQDRQAPEGSEPGEQPE